jgi:hypothetical protein
MITCEGGVISAQAAGDRIAISDRGTLPPELQNLRDFFVRSGHHFPALALVHDTVVGDGIPAGFTVHGKRVSLIPIHQTIGKDVHLPPSRIHIGASSPGARRLRFRGEWQPIHQSNSSTNAVFDAWLPGPFTQLHPETVSVKFVAENRGLNVRFSVRLLPFDSSTEIPEAKKGAEGDAFPPDAIAPSAVDGDTFTFAQLPAELRDPSDGLFRVIIRAEPIKRLPPEQALRANAWEVRQFDVSVSGSMPPHIRGSF